VANLFAALFVVHSAGVPGLKGAGKSLDKASPRPPLIEAAAVRREGLGCDRLVVVDPSITEKKESRLVPSRLQPPPQKTCSTPVAG
jgi:hypothetical protein